MGVYGLLGPNLGLSIQEKLFWIKVTKTGFLSKRDSSQNWR